MYLYKIYSMKTDTVNLKSYSVAAGTFLMLGINADSQVVYENIDPDAFVGFTFYNLDVNDDGIFDLKFKSSINVYTSWSYYDTWTISTRKYLFIDDFDAVIDNPTHPDSFGIAVLGEGNIIGSAGPWNSGDHVSFANFIYDGGLDVNYLEWNDSNIYFGFRFQAADGSHYGWMRLSIADLEYETDVLPHLILQSYAYELTPDLPIIINDPAAPQALNLQLYDDAETGTASDLHMQFDPAIEENKISEYRIFLYKDGTPPPTVSFLESLSADRYYSILPAGINYDFTFPEGMLDKSGMPVEAEIYYRAIILSMADGILTTLNDVSFRSEPAKIDYHTAQSPDYIKVFEDMDAGNISDFIVSFNDPQDEMGTDYYKIFLLNINNDVYDPQELLELPENYYGKLNVSGAETNEYRFLSSKLIVDDDYPIIFQSYYAVVFAIPDSVSATISSYNDSFDNYYGQAEYFNSHYPETPIVTIDDTTKTSSDVHVYFPRLEDEGIVDRYKIMVVDVQDTAAFTADDAMSLNGSGQFTFLPLGEDIDINLPENFLDINKQPLSVEKIYVVYVAIVTSDYIPRISMSRPSNPFTLNDGFVDLDPDIICSDNILNVKSFGDEPFILMIYNGDGRILKKIETTGSVEIDCNDLPAGIYLVTFTQNQFQSVKKIFISSHKK